MRLTNGSIFQKLKKAVLEAKSKSSNLLIISFAGSGSSHYLKDLAKSDSSLTYINSKEAKLGNYSLLDNNLADSIELLKSADNSQKCALLINAGSDFDSPDLKSVISHFYINFILGVSSVEEIKDMVNRYQPDASEEYFNQLVQDSGCIPKLAKQLLINPNEVDDLVDKILSSLSGYPPQILKEFGLLDDSFAFLSPLLRNKSGQIIDIKLNFDLSFSENGSPAIVKLTPSEMHLVKKMIENKGKITKEEVSDIKWGINKYDEFSDQAINKAMRRLNQKLKLYQIITIPKVGFQLQTK